VTGAAGKRRLGRGLEALLGPTTVAEARAEGLLTELPVVSLRPNRYQPRHAFDTAALDELAASMKSSGLLQPVVVRAADGELYELIAGERRWRAAQQLGWERIPAVVRDVDDRTLLTLALVENLQRDALSPIDEARGYERLIGEFDLSQARVAEMVGRDRSTVANAIRLLNLPAVVQDMLHAGQLSTGHARALLGLADAERITTLARRTVEQQWSVREVEDLVRGTRTPTPPGRRRAMKPRAPEVRRLEEALRQRLQTDVRITTRGKSSGRLTVNFYSHDDLARVIELILGKPFEG
jgi:ParB family chromosome partitioning protein